MGYEAKSLSYYVAGKPKGGEGSVVRDIKLDLKSKIPIYIQIRDQLKLKIATGDLNEGTKMMPVRDLAQHLLINPNTVAKAYHELEHEGYINTHRGMGTYVSKRAGKLSEAEFGSHAEQIINAMVHDLMDLGLQPDQIREMVDKVLGTE